MNARQKRLFEEARQRNPNMKMPERESAPSGELTDDELALLKQGVGDKSPRQGGAAGSPAAESSESYESGEQTGWVVKYFEDKGFGFIRPENGGRDVFFHVSRLSEGFPNDLAPNVKVVFEVGMDSRSGKLAASSLRILPAETT